MRTSFHSSHVDVGRILLAMITILTIAGTLSACGRYGSPVRSASVEAGDRTGDESGNKAGNKAGVGVGVDAESAAEVGKLDPESKDPSAEEESDLEEEDEDEDDLAE